MAEPTKINVDIKQVETLGFDFRQMAEVGLRRTVERGEQLLREEVPKKTHNLEQGVSSDVDVSALRGDLIVSARSGRVGIEGALLHEASGKTKEISLRPQPAFDYAEAVARGTGIYGPRGAVITPKSGKALLIPIDGPPVSLGGKVVQGKRTVTLSGQQESYITSGGKTFIVRRFSKGMKPNQYDVRAAQRLEAEVQAIWERVVAAFANQEKEF
jgi:hypothetical protein